MEPRKKVILNILEGIAGIAVVFITGTVVFRGILFNSNPNVLPWGSDTLGHVARVNFLIDSLVAGQLYPELDAHWYMGIQLFRYYSPLPYYLIAGLTWLTLDPVTSVNIFISICTFFGGASLLLYRRWFGYWMSLSGGLLFMALPDNLRVAFSEGNISRVGAFALLPLLVYFLLRASEKNNRRRYQAGIAITIFFIILNHAMMGAIYAGFMVILILMMAIIKIVPWRQSMISMSSLMSGVLLSGFWLLPSFTGGITELSSSAVTQGLTTERLTTLLNPMQRFSNLEVNYAGLALFIFGLIGLVFPRGRNRFTILFTITGFLGVLAMTPGLFDLVSAIPGISLLWPARFLGIATFFILLSVLWSGRLFINKLPFVSILAILLLALDFYPSLRLVFLRPANNEIAESGRRIATASGWREATLDKSALGSAATYLLDIDNKREQLFGWAYQGARTASNLASINDALDFNEIAYIQDRLNLFGVDDVVIESRINQKSDLGSNFMAAGYKQTYTGDSVSLYQREGSPRAVIQAWPAIAIGRSASSYAMLFPQIILGNSYYIDDYSLMDLLHFKKIILAGITWHDKKAAEDLVRSAAANGVDVYIDLTLSREDPLARIPQFLGVWGESISLHPEPILASKNGEDLSFLGFSDAGELWHTHSVQGLQVNEVTFEYLGQPTVIAGYNQIEEKKVWFIGLNLIYHTKLTKDIVTQELLASILGLTPGEKTEYSVVPLLNYAVDAGGYQFEVQTEQAERILIPVAVHDGTVVKIDGFSTVYSSYENMVVLDLPAGKHSVLIMVEQTKIYLLGSIASGVGMVGLLFLLFAKPQKMITTKEDEVTNDK